MACTASTLRHVYVFVCVQTVAHAAVETHLNVPEGLTQQELSERAAKTQAACCRWTIAF